MFGGWNGDRSGFSLVEMTIVLVLAGLVGTAAITLFTTNNRLNTIMTTTGQSQENARSAVDAVASELRGLSAGSITHARPEFLSARMPLAFGVICEVSAPHVSIYFAFGGRPVSLSAADGYAVRDTTGDWVYMADAGALNLSSSGGARSACVGNGNSGTEPSTSYVRFHVPGGRGTGHARGRRNSATIDLVRGQPIMLFQRRVYSLAPSQLESGRRALYRGRYGQPLVELAQGFGSEAGFLYQIADGRWIQFPLGEQLDGIQTVRVRAEVVSDPQPGLMEAQSFSLVREIPLRNVE